ncbi:MAG TPA: gamma-glutamyl-gamma-aminobutyrate hydrolase family protein [Terriglobia bacterium]|nr:gamma-glutamyl-gamma-aminobutyrate hydrolase family protein [Terriglobia bacterium]
MKRPAVLTVTRRTIRKNKLVDFTGEFHLELLMRFGLLPVMIPVAEGALDCLPQYEKGMHALLLVEGPDIEPKHYQAGESNFKYLEETHPNKDEIEIRLVRRALRLRLPILGICRGSELVNVLCGGTLYGDVSKEKESSLQHIDYDHYDTFRHGLSIVPGTPLAQWYKRRTMRVNSYHHQGIRKLAHRFTPMAYAEDGLIEAYFDAKSEFTVGLQFHPERMLKDYAGNLRVWKAFASAVHRSTRRRNS